MLNSNITGFYDKEAAKKFNKNTAIFIQEVNYWASKATCGVVDEDGNRWVYNTYHQWAERIGCSVATVKRIVSNLKKLGIAQVKKFWEGMPRANNQTNFYRIDEEAYKRHVLEDDKAIPPAQNDPDHRLKMTQTTGSKRPELIQRIPTENTYNSFAPEQERPRAKAKPQEEKKIKTSVFKEEEEAKVAPGSLLSRLKAFNRNVAETNQVKERLGNPCPEEEVAKRAKADRFKRLYAPYASLTPLELVKSLCAQNLPAAHKPAKDKSNMENLASWYQESPSERLAPIVDAFRAIKAGSLNVWTAAYVLNGLKNTV